MVNFDVIIVLITLLFLLISIYRNWLGLGLTFFIAIIVLLVCEVISPNDIVKSIANQQVVIILILLLIGEIIKDLGIVQRWFDLWFKKDITKNKFMMQIFVIVGSFSAFLNNTPLVAIMMPYISDRTKGYNIAPSKLLIPLSYIAILGGCVTLVGTSTNLIVNSMIVNQGISQLEELDMFDFTYVGFPMLIIGTLYLYFFSNKLLPSRNTAIESIKQSNRKYIIQAHIKEKSTLIGKELNKSNLTNIEGMELMAIYRNNKRIESFSATYTLKENDIFYFVGDNSNISELLDKNTELHFPDINKFKEEKNVELIEIAISYNSTFISKKIHELHILDKYNASVLAIYRNGEKLSIDKHSFKLLAGDVLLLFTTPTFLQKSMRSSDFYIISRVRKIKKIKSYISWIMLGGVGISVLLAALKFVPLFTSLLCMIGLISALKIAHPKDIISKLDYNLAFIIILALAFGKAMIKSGVSDIIANNFLNFFMNFGILGILFAIYFITSLLAAYITNKAAVAIMFPIALTLAIQQGINPEPLILTVSFAAAANFITPIGYQTNLMIYGPGGYLFKDFFKIGFPLTLIYMIVTVLILWSIYF